MNIEITSGEAEKIHTMIEGLSDVVPYDRYMRLKETFVKICNKPQAPATPKPPGKTEGS